MLSGVFAVGSSGVGGDLKGPEAPSLSGPSEKLPVVSVPAPDVKVSGEIPSSKLEMSSPPVESLKADIDTKVGYSHSCRWWTPEKY